MIRALELSRKIYESGFEPDMMARSSKGSTNIYLTIGKPDMQEDIKSFFNIYPWFSADWCWKMLPDSIDHFNSLVVTKNAIVYEESPDHISAYYCEIKDSLHEALLETICWCIDNGHIKAVK